MLIKESEVKDFLFNEIEEKKEHRTKVAIHEALFSEVEDREKILEEDERLEKEAMAQQSGGSNLKNSGWNTEWKFGDSESDIERVKGEVAQKATHFFASMNGQGPFSASNTSDLRPRALAFTFHYFRTILPGKDGESAKKAQNALDVLERYLPGFQQFQQDIERSNIPLNPYFMVSKFSGSDGGIDESNLQQFVSQEQGKQLALPDGREIPSTSHYKEHADRIANGQSVNRTNYVDKEQIFSMSEINTATASMLKQAITDREKDGYVLKVFPMGENDTGPSLVGSIKNLYNQRLADNNIEQNTRIADPVQREQSMIYLYHYGKMQINIEKWQKDPSSINITAFELRLILQNMLPMHGSQPKTPPDQFKASVKTLYAANGWDSSSNNPNAKMLTLPPLRQLPRGEVVYDRGNGNMGYDHLILNWKNGLSQLFQTWGSKCDEWLSTLQGQGMQEIAQQSPEVGAALQNIISTQSGNRTGAEALLDLFNDHPTWESFNRNHLQKSLASEIRSVNKLRKNQVPLQSFQGGDLQQQIQAHVQQILQIGQTDPNAANEQLTKLSSELVQHYMSGSPGMDWKNLTLALHALNAPVAAAGMQYQTENGAMQRVSNGLTAHPTSRKRTMLDQQGFEMLKTHGYQVGKMMDFLSAVMYRSCHEQKNTPFGSENSFGHQYSTSSGTSKGGEIILTVNYSKLDASVSSSDVATQTMIVDVYEQLSFNLSQKSGSNDDPILLRSSLPWEQMVDAFNEMYPEAGYQFAVVNEPISRDLDMLEQKVKEAINETRGNIKVIYHNSSGNEIVLSGIEIATDEMAIKEEAGETDLIDTTQEAIAQPAQPTAPETEWSMPFQPSPNPTEVEEPFVLEQAPVPQAPTTPQQQMPKSKPMSDPATVPIHDPSSRYIQKKDTKGRRLLRHNAGLGSIEERLQKAANKLDECSEFDVADKIDLLLQKINEGKDVREASHI